MPIMTEAMKKHFSLPIFEKEPVLLSFSGGEAAAQLSTNKDGFLLDMAESCFIPPESQIDVSLRSTREVMMYFRISSGGILDVNDTITLPAKVNFGCEVEPEKSEPIFLKGDGDNPDILII